MARGSSRSMMRSHPSRSGVRRRQALHGSADRLLPRHVRAHEAGGAAQPGAGRAVHAGIRNPTGHPRRRRVARPRDVAPRLLRRRRPDRRGRGGRAPGVHRADGMRPGRRCRHHGGAAPSRHHPTDVGVDTRMSRRASRGRGRDSAGPHLGRAQLTGNEWNLGGTGDAGSVAMALDAEGSLHVDGRFSATPPCTDERCIAPQANTWVRSFPSVLYGIDQCHADTSPPRRRACAPDQGRLAAFDHRRYHDLRRRRTNVTHDVAYDLWLNPSGTTTPCQTDGTLEVMVWTDHDARDPARQLAGRARFDPLRGWRHRVAGRRRMDRVRHQRVRGRTHGTVGRHRLARPRPRPNRRPRDRRRRPARRAASVGSLLENTYGWSNFATHLLARHDAFGIEFGPHDADPYSAGRLSSVSTCRRTAWVSAPKSPQPTAERGSRTRVGGACTPEFTSLFCAASCGFARHSLATRTARRPLPKASRSAGILFVRATSSS